MAQKNKETKLEKLGHCLFSTFLKHVLTFWWRKKKLFMSGVSLSHDPALNQYLIILVSENLVHCFFQLF